MTTVPSSSSSSSDASSKVLPYTLPLLSLECDVNCSSCKKIYGAGTEFPWHCQLCGYSVCGACAGTMANEGSDNHRLHAFFCSRARFDNALKLVDDIFAPVDMAPVDTDVAVQLTHDPLHKASMICLLADHLQYKDSIEFDAFVNAMRNSAAFYERVFTKMPLKDKHGKKRLTTSFAIEGATQRLKTTLMSSGRTIMDRVFVALLLSVQPYWEVMGQCAQYLVTRQDAKLALALAFTADPVSGTPAEKEQRQVLLAYPVTWLDVYASTFKGYGVGINTTTANQMGFTTFIKVLFDNARKDGRPINYMFHVTLVHMHHSELQMLSFQGKWDPSKIDTKGNAAPPALRPATTDFIVRIMGTPDAPQMLVLQMHSTLYSLDRWLKGTLFTNEDAHLAKSDLCKDPTTFHVLQKAKLEAREEWLASQRLHYVIAEPKFAGARTNGMVQGTENIFEFAQHLDVLATPEVPRGARHASYAAVTGVNWPTGDKMQLKRFSLIVMPANLLA